MLERISDNLLCIEVLTEVDIEYLETIPWRCFEEFLYCLAAYTTTLCK